MKTLNDTLKNLADVDEPISVAGLYALSGTDKAQIEQVKTDLERPARRSTRRDHAPSGGDWRREF